MDQAIIINTPNQYQVMLENYASILEKTNQQTSLWLNPYGLSVGILTLMVAIGAIVVAWYLWKNSKEQRDLYFSTIESHKKQIEDQYKVLIEEKKIEIQKVVEDFEKAKDSVTDEKKMEFESLIKEYKKKIKNLEKQQSTISSYKEPSKVFYDNPISSSGSILSLHSRSEIKKKFCSECGKSFEYFEEVNDPWNFSSRAVGLDVYNPSEVFTSSKKVHCSHCGTINIVN